MMHHRGDNEEASADRATRQARVRGGLGWRLSVRARGRAERLLGPREDLRDERASFSLRAATELAGRLQHQLPPSERPRMAQRAPRTRGSAARRAAWWGWALALALAACDQIEVRPAPAPPVAPPPAVIVPEPPERLTLPPRVAPLRPRNVVLISIDTLRADHLSAYGYPRPTSPALDALAADATLFEQAYANSPKTAESHMTLFTGLYPGAHGVKNGSERSERLSDRVPTLATLLRRAGYRTVGYHGGGNMQAELGFDQGFERYERRGPVDVLFRRGSEFLEREARSAESPFLLFLHTKTLHDPYDPPERYARLFADPEYSGEVGMTAAELARAAQAGGWPAQHRVFWKRVDAGDPADVQRLRDLYDALIREMDDQLGLFLARFTELGFGADTLLVFLSDHGEAFQEHGDFRHNSMYREVLHVPLVVRLPDGEHEELRGARSAFPVALVDVLPTLLDYLGLPAPAHVQGRSFYPFFERQAEEFHYVFSQWEHRDLAALRAGPWKYLRRGTREEMYDLDADPGEQHDLADAHPGISNALRERVEHIAGVSQRLARSSSARTDFELDAEARAELEALGYIDGGN